MNQVNATPLDTPQLSFESFSIFEKSAINLLQCSGVDDFCDSCFPKLIKFINARNASYAWKKSPRETFQIKSYKEEMLPSVDSLEKQLSLLSTNTLNAEQLLHIQTEANSVYIFIQLNHCIAGAIHFEFHSITERTCEAEGLLRAIAVLFASSIRAEWTQHEMQTQLASERKRMNRMLGPKLYPHHASGSSLTLTALNEQIEQAAQSNTNVLITGEPGVETERVASAIHAASSNAQNVMASIHCSAHSEEELTLRLFDSENNIFKKAIGGSVFLNEVGTLPSSLQIKLHNELAGTANKDIRLIAASTNDLENAVQQGKFREDLYYQLNVLSIRIPPLRERREDILTLAEIFAERSARHQAKHIERLGTGAVQALLNYYWPGNVTELEASLDYAVKRADTPVIHARHLPLAVRTPSEDESSAGFLEQVSQLEADLLYDALKRTHGNISAAARDLGITARMVRYKVQKLNIPFEDLFKRKA